MPISQISSAISAETRERLDRFTQTRGLKKSWVVEKALEQFMDSREFNLEESFTPSHITLRNEDFDALVGRHEQGGAEPSEALKELMREDD